MHNYHLKDNKCPACDDACDGCTGAGAKLCKTCKAIGYTTDPVLGCKACELIFDNC